MDNPTPPSLLIPTVLPPATGFTNTNLTPHATDNCFVDQHGRTVLLRGVNVSGEAKVPTLRFRKDSNAKDGVQEEGLDYTCDGFAESEKAEEWMRRLRMWGIGVIRWVMTWEAVEPVEM